MAGRFRRATPDEGARRAALYCQRNPKEVPVTNQKTKADDQRYSAGKKALHKITCPWESADGETKCDTVTGVPVDGEMFLTDAAAGFYPHGWRCTAHQRPYPTWQPQPADAPRRLRAYRREQAAAREAAAARVADISAKVDAQRAREARRRSA